MDTIFALSTAPGKAGVAVIRLSGPLSGEAVRKLCGNLPEPRQAAFRRLSDSAGEFLDEAIVIFFPEGRSYTGECVCELHVHGARAIIEAIIGYLGSMPGLRLADAGEFTLRALGNGKMGLVEVEGLADLLDAETEAQRRQACKSFDGAFSRKIESWRSGLIECAALIEAAIDFSEEDLPIDPAYEVIDRLRTVSANLRAEIEGIGIAERVREGFEIAIVGAPNTGKSTLLNYLAGREAAITSEIAGTTRDVIEVAMDISGFSATFLDTAGIRESTDPIEKIGVNRTLNRATAADMRVFLLNSADSESYGIKPRHGDLILRAKADLLANGTEAAVSGKTGKGVSEMVSRIAKELQNRAAVVGVATRQRHGIAISSAISYLESADNELNGNVVRIEIAAEEVRKAIGSLESLLGRVDAEHVLGEIFGRFCIGK